MRSLNMNPTSHEIELICDELIVEDGYASISIQLSVDSENRMADGLVTEKEALAISKWFADLAKALKPPKKKKVN